MEDCINNDNESNSNETVLPEKESLFDTFTLLVVTGTLLVFRIFNIYLVCCWCQTTFAAIMAAIAMIIGCSLIHSKIYSFLTNGESSKLIKQLTVNVMLNCDSGEYLDKLNKLTRDYRWAILLFQGLITCILKFTIG